MRKWAIILIVLITFAAPCLSVAQEKEYMGTIAGIYIEVFKEPPRVELKLNEFPDKFTVSIKKAVECGLVESSYSESKGSEATGGVGFLKRNSQAIGWKVKLITRRLGRQEEIITFQKLNGN